MKLTSGEFGLIWVMVRAVDPTTRRVWISVNAENQATAAAAAEPIARNAVPMRSSLGASGGSSEKSGRSSGTVMTRRLCAYIGAAHARDASYVNHPPHRIQRGLADRLRQRRVRMDRQIHFLDRVLIGSRHH